MLITIDNLRRGILVWESKGSRWPADLCAPLYAKLSRWQADGMTPDWWTLIVNQLWDWRAIRGPAPPNTKAEIREIGLDRLDELRAQAECLTEAARPEPPTLDSCEWGDVAGLYEVAHSIKGSSTPVFGSKLCHFILPNAFPVIDGEFTGHTAGSYRTYWQRCRAEWVSCVERKPLFNELHGRIRPEHVTTFPWSTKIAELCVAGSK